ncbi:MAG: serine/threonine-protein kinase [Myxococcota bacterium]
MTTATPATPVSTPAAPSATEADAPELSLHGRVRLFLKVIVLILSLFMTVAAITQLTGVDDQAEFFRTRLRIMAPMNGTCALGWFLLARTRPPLLATVVIEGAACIVVALGFSLLLFTTGPPPTRGESMVALFIIAMIVVLRAALIPCPVIATTAVSASAMAIPIGFQLVVMRDLPVILHIWQVVLGVVVVVVTTVSTYTIFGLQQRAATIARLGQYQLERRIGEGAMGVVYLAKHALLHRPTAVKLLRDVRSREARTRFRKEVQTASSLSHPNTVEIYDYGRTPEGIFFFAMEYVEGASLETVVRATGAMPPARVLHLLDQATGSLGETHRRGLVHRDIKPSNLMLCARGGHFDTLKVLDFGLVHEMVPAGSSGAAGLAGTPMYMAPEVILDGDGHVPESDIYALGATAYFLLTGRPPFATEDLAELLSDHLATDPEPLQSGDPDLDALVLQCLAKPSDDRPSSGATLRDALRRCPTFGTWTDADARVWWDEHREIIDASHRAQDRATVNRSRAFLGRRSLGRTT